MDMDYWKKRQRERTFLRWFLAVLAVAGAAMLGAGFLIGEGEFASGLKLFGSIALMAAFLYAMFFMTGNDI
ncbi:MAG TPA: hypothetical protein VMD53_08295 [Rhizomicrobium sp.]|nr:hypothetical protein [Rhizomicrobium sp.]